MCGQGRKGNLHEHMCICTHVEAKGESWSYKHLKDNHLVLEC